VYDSSSSLEEYLHTVAYVFEDGDLVDFIESNKAAYDYVLLDIPGTIQQQGVISALAAVDKVIVPTTFADDDIASTLKFIDLLIDLGMSYRVLMNKYEIQFDSTIRDAELNNFKPLEELFGENVVFSKGIRFERSALQSNFVLGFYDLSHSKMKRVDEVMELIFEYVND
jgi:cellulose biosynthesis protein BcsQ